MARLITTPAEKAAASYLDWDDAALGAFCKKMALLLQAARKDKREGGLKNDDIDAVINAADGILLIGSMIEMSAGSLQLEFGDFTHDGQPGGDWRIKIKKIQRMKLPVDTEVRAVPDRMKVIEDG